MKLQHEFEVPASPSETMELLLDAERVVPCLPGAALVEVTDDGTWKTTMAVKLGPVGLDFLNDVRIVDQDDAAGVVRLAVKGRDKRGRGGADATVDARMVDRSGGGTKVTLDSDIRFSGQAAQLGRPSVIQDVSSRLLDRFAECLRTRLDPPVTANGETGEAAPPLPPPVQKPISGLSLLLVAVRGSLARLLRRRPRSGEEGSS
ncbi:MAG: SRPBCC family protein [Gaiellaceae bacterium MAG52_C11]|nr:SRPBCC family protein [Candidatus Gaiellasilicea maunaloa]